MICTTEQATICAWITKENLHRPSLQKTLCGQTTCCAGKGGDRWLVHKFPPPCRICNDTVCPCQQHPYQLLVEARSEAADGQCWPSHGPLSEALLHACTSME